jgi:hypothetical protein
MLPKTISIPYAYIYGKIDEKLLKIRKASPFEVISRVEKSPHNSSS